MGKDINKLLNGEAVTVRKEILPLLAKLCGTWSYSKVCEVLKAFGDSEPEKRKELVDTFICLSENWNRCKPKEGEPRWNGYQEAENRYWDFPREEYFDYCDQVEEGKEQREMENLLPLASTQIEWLRRWAADVPDEAPEPKSMSAATTADHFNVKKWSKDRLQAIYENLIRYGYIATQTTFEQWQYICTGKGENEPHTAIIWKATQSELAYLCNKIEHNGGETRLWQTACKVFRLGTGKPLNIDTMKSELNHKIDTKKWRMMKERLEL